MWAISLSVKAKGSLSKPVMLSRNSVAFVPSRPVASTTNAMNRKSSGVGKNFSYLLRFRSSSVPAATRGTVLLLGCFAIYVGALGLTTATSMKCFLPSTVNWKSEILLGFSGSPLLSSLSSCTLLNLIISHLGKRRFKVWIK